jgi:hypothetical protein
MIRSLADREERERRAAKAGMTLPPLPGEVVPEPVVPAAAEEIVAADAAPTSDVPAAEPEALAAGVQQQ